ncbi:MAG TPA: M20/M25/M40 family metallo-hydrolase [Rhodanobacteraceae bacterium]|nr:M20/M25/M40 family metallo-hydrolase [Rhodanobacteraceae bacterium]
MDGLLDATLAHLRALVAFDTRNPPRAIGTGIFDYLRGQLQNFDVRVTDHGAGAVSLLAMRGEPKLLFNVHLDTVPDSPTWSASPFELRVGGDRAIGLGACDIKGAAAALLAAAKLSDGDMALLFTTDEEGADPRCIKAFLAANPSPPGRRWRAAPDEGSRTDGGHNNTEPSPQRCALGATRRLSRRERGFEAVIVAEPTRCKAVLAHRGIQSVRARFEGRAGHASSEQKPSDSALHQAVRWGAAALDFAEARSTETFGSLRGLRLNIGRLEGGIKANMIAPEAELRLGMRPLPSVDMDGLLEGLRTLVDQTPLEFEETFRGPTLPANAADAESRLRDARALADELGIPVGEAVDFWTEAALFSGAGCTTFVYGPGDIAQAHSADEWVALDELEAAARTYLGITEKSS